MSARRWTRCSLAAAVAVSLLAGAASAWQTLVIRPAQAERAVGPGQPIAGNMAGSIALQENRDLRRKLDLIVKRIEGKHYAEAAHNLGALLEDPATGDFFLTPDANHRSRRNFKAEVRRLIGSLPDEGRKSYEDQFGPNAKKLLGEAIAGGDWAGLQQVALRYFHTEAGHDALFMLGREHIDRGRPREGAACLEWIADSPQRSRFEPDLSLLLAVCWRWTGEDAKAQQFLTALKSSHPTAAWQVGEKSISVFGDGADALAWLTQNFLAGDRGNVRRIDGWLVLRGDASRNAPRAAGLPFAAPRWRHDVASAGAHEQIERERAAYVRSKVTPMPMLFPLAVEETVLMRTGQGLRAYDIVSGRHVWSYPSDDDDAGIDQSIWRDAAFGSLSSDGDRAFVIHGNSSVAGDVAGLQPGMAGPVFWGGRFGGPWGGPMWAGNLGDGSDHGPGPNVNQLSAIQISRQGSLAWRVGGVDGADEPLLAGHFFLGPPLPYAGRLYAVAECASSVKLVVIDARTGKLQWVQELGIVEQGIAADPFRRMSGASPAISAGVIVCPTSAGGVVAIDLATQSLVWAYQYPRKQETRLNPETGNYPRMQQGNRWVDATAVIAGGRVLLTPLESNEIHCLNLTDGKLLWTQPRGDHLFLACVHDDKALLVGQYQMTRVGLADGKPVGTPIRLPGAMRPTGQGVYCGAHYYLPIGKYSSEGDVTVSEGGIAQIDLAQGTIAKTVQSDRGLVPGNLILHKGMFISQGTSYFEAYEQSDAMLREVQEALAADPNDPRGLMRLAESELSQGKLAEAIGHFRQSHKLKPTKESKSRLIAALLDGISAKLPNAKELEKELDELAGL
ncbi:MAG: PQQ-binding-like beta-propeller repeat protein [Planctomycetia bacterium]|nr:PQQ-binding-like beta-propeller repeat protein [Planctomycetia bacterium]